MSGAQGLGMQKLLRKPTQTNPAQQVEPGATQESPSRTHICGCAASAPEAAGAGAGGAAVVGGRDEQPVSSRARTHAAAPRSRRWTVFIGAGPYHHRLVHAGRTPLRPAFSSAPSLRRQAQASGHRWTERLPFVTDRVASAQPHIADGSVPALAVRGARRKVVERLERTGAEGAGGTREQFAKNVRDEYSGWKAVIQRAGIKAD